VFNVAMDTDFRENSVRWAHPRSAHLDALQRRDGRKLMITPGGVPLLKPRRNEELIESLVRRTPVAGTPKSIFQPIAPA
jgi:hypothetical protein